MVNPSRAAARLLIGMQKSAPSAYVCPSCRIQPIARNTRRFASSDSQSVRHDTTALTQDQHSPFEGLETQSVSFAPIDGPNVSQVAPVEPKQLRPASPRRRTPRAGNPENDPEYAPAKTWEGLERVGTKSWIQKMRDPGDSFEGWSMKGRTEITDANIDEVMDRINRATFEGLATPMSESRKIDSDEKRMKLLYSVAQITGMRIPDFKFQAVRSLHDVRQLLLVKPKSRKVFSDVKANLSKTQNVRITSHRWTQIHKDKDKGKWKLIVKGLRERGLPVTKQELTQTRQLL
ncbi:hypothetical protein K461DRAFT_283321 [Myriangium duriaei CBS 260.36]|uniref:Uncharacterized protein n=1 Tax=Myriangium duriaei CBS 260.36 TaxID=1168546 RepID=A0A9P4IPI8_9PEZI|nr:hypothetical protein K461DRAFT_283321 [Myriangium duriaei CBS 260.36]